MLKKHHYLFATCDAGGNLQPELILAARLRARGHDVRFLGHRSQQRSVQDAGFGFRPYRTAPEWDWNEPGTAPVRDWELKPLQAFAELREKVLFGPAPLFAADVLDEIEAESTDAVAVDSFLFGAMAAVERSGLPSAVMWHTVFSRSDCDTPTDGAGTTPAKGWPGKLRDRAMKAIELRLWNKGLPALNEARGSIGLRPLQSVFEQLDRMDRVLVMTSRWFDFAALTGSRLPDNVAFVGPQVELGSVSSPSHGEVTDPPLVLVSASTCYQGQEQFLDRVVAALGTLPVRALVTTGHAVSFPGPTPPDVEVAAWVPHSTVLPDAAVVITHGGHGTVMASLAHGVPAICLPMGRDQLDNAARLVHSGAGLRLSPKASQRHIVEAVRTVLGDEQMTVAARRLAEAIQREVASDLGSAELEELAVAVQERPVREKGDLN
jgi:MGT family glycosyltransferase